MALTDENLVDVPGLASRWVRLQSGANAHYVTVGESGPNVVLLHGGIIGSSGTAGWRFTAPFLAENGFRVYCPDQPGFGLTEGGEIYHPSSAGHVDFLQDFVTALGLDRFYLAGNSMGCINSVQYTTAHPERVIQLLLIAGGVGDIVSPEALAAADTRSEEAKRAGRDRTFDGTPASMQKMMEAIIYRREAISEDLLNMRTFAANRNLELFNKRRDYAKNPDPNISKRLSTKGRFNEMSIPTIYLYGRQDVVIPVEGGYLQEDACPKIQFFYPDECGHQGQTDQPDMFNQVFLEFFRDGKVTNKTAEWAGISKRRPPLANLVEV